ncbi:hypothetical protein ACQP2F_15530 [Actinoplanes sp. CA-030573]|uniref:hypothetical protein n=1 Tax=Actinoplanes sp. CA-030573 TaxID=3239898 RepID=UPI003D92BE74
MVTGVVLAVLCLSQRRPGATIATAIGFALLAAMHGNRTLVRWAVTFAVIMGVAASGLLRAFTQRCALAESLLALGLGAAMIAAGMALRQERENG